MENKLPMGLAVTIKNPLVFWTEQRYGCWIKIYSEVLPAYEDMLLLIQYFQQVWFLKPFQIKYKYLYNEPDCGYDLYLDRSTYAKT